MALLLKERRMRSAVVAWIMIVTVAACGPVLGSP